MAGWEEDDVHSNYHSPRTMVVGQVNPGEKAECTKPANPFRNRRLRDELPDHHMDGWPGCDSELCAGAGAGAGVGSGGGAMVAAAP